VSLDRGSVVAVVGASLAGLRASETLRAEGYEGRILLVGAERHLPYDRPPLSKQYLAGAWGLEKVQLRPPEKIDALGLELRLGRRACSLDVSGHRLELDDGETVAFDAAVVATGAHPVTLAGAAGTRSWTLRTLEDAQGLADAVGEGTRVVVVGAGFIGSEVAATCHERGAHVTVVEALATPLSRVLGEEMGATCAALHTHHDVELRTGVAVDDVRPAPQEAAASEVVLADGSVLEADVVVVGIGVQPTTDWLEGSGLEVRDGVVCDARLFAAPDVVVAGDLARWFDQRVGEELRIEHWTNAAEQGMTAARNLLAGRPAAVPYMPVPYFWSDQYDTKIQVIGHPRPGDEVVVVDGSPEERRFVALYGRDGKFSAALGFSRPRQLMAYRALLESGATFDAALAHQR
jgi:3-phenylpropionate/trans-cinnamate dioxygenase ferredoxin reductase subunit